MYKTWKTLNWECLHILLVKQGNSASTKLLSLLHSIATACKLHTLMVNNIGYVAWGKCASLNLWQMQPSNSLAYSFVWVFVFNTNLVHRFLLYHRPCNVSSIIPDLEYQSWTQLGISQHHARQECCHVTLWRCLELAVDNVAHCMAADELSRCRF